MPVRCALAFFELGDHLLARSADAPQVVELGVEAVANVAAVAHERAGLFDEAAVDVVAHVDQIVERADERAGERRLACLEHEPHARHDRDRLLQADEIARARTCRARRARRGARDPARDFKTSRNLPRSVLRNANSSTASRRSRMRSSETRGRSSQAAQQAAGHGGHRAIDLVKQGAVAAALHRFDDFEMLERDSINQQAVGRRLVRDAAHMCEVGLLRVAQVVEQCAGRRHGERMRVETEPFEPVRAELVDQRAAGRFVFERPRLDAGDRQPFSGAVEQHARSDRDRSARRSRAAAAPCTSSASACRPAVPAYSAQENSPVVRSSSAAPTMGSAVRPASDFRMSGVRLNATASRNAGARSSRCCESVSVPGETTRTISRLTIPLAFFGSSTWSQMATRKPFLTRRARYVSSGVMGHAAHRDRRALAVFRARGERQIERARGHERVFVEHLVEIAHAKKQDRVAILLLRIEILPHGRRDVRCVSRRRGGTRCRHVELNFTCWCSLSTRQPGREAWRSRATAALLAAYRATPGSTHGERLPGDLLRLLDAHATARRRRRSVCRRVGAGIVHGPPHRHRHDAGSRARQQPNRWSASRPSTRSTTPSPLSPQPSASRERRGASGWMRSAGRCFRPSTKTALPLECASWSGRRRFLRAGHSMDRARTCLPATARSRIVT